MKKLMIIVVAVIAILATACSRHQLDVRVKLLADNSLVFIKADSSARLAVGDTIVLQAFSDAYGHWNDWQFNGASVKPVITSDSLVVVRRHCYAKAVVIKIAN